VQIPAEYREKEDAAIRLKMTCPVLGEISGCHQISEIKEPATRTRSTP
jgi:hypothetical protein